ncbi:MAG: anti-sigma factor antagonist [Leptospirales bacterium]|nr:anti-sigma factor antagonist [Leptospirales bacterium]
MKIDVYENDKTISLKVYGDIELITIKPFKEKLFEIGDKANKDVEMDLYDVDYIDSSGIGILIILLKLQKKKGKKFVIKKASPRILDLFKLTSLTDLFELEI